MASIPFGDKVKLDGGLRIEDNLQQLIGFDLNQNSANVSNHIVRALPSANMSFNFTEKSLVRVAYGPNAEQTGVQRTGWVQLL